MFTSKDFNSIIEVQKIAIRAVIRETLRKIFSDRLANFEKINGIDTIAFEDNGSESFYSMTYADCVITGVQKCENDYGKIMIQNEDWSTSYWDIDCEDLTILDYIGILSSLESVKGVMPVEQLYFNNGVDNSRV